MRTNFFGLTDIGKKREFNEDRYLCADFSDAVPEEKRPLHLFAVADGIGGHAGGEEASSLAVQTLRETLEPGIRSGSGDIAGPELIEEAFHRANEIIFRKSTETDRLAGMGTTLVAALVSGMRTVAANVGDSRLYLVRGKTLTQISRDHSWAAEQLRLKVLSENDVARSPFRNIVTRSLGFAASVSVDTFEVELKDQDYLLLCTDGLYGPLGERGILRVFKKHHGPTDICRRLVHLAEKSGGRDNITAVVVQVF
jgi:protein phosphatase